MLDAFAWLGKLAEQIGSIIPRPLIIKSSHSGVLYLFGRWPKVLRPGWYLIWPLFMDYETTPICRQYVTGQATLETLDGKAVDVGFLVCYEVKDVLVFLAENENPYEAIDDAGAAAVARVIQSMRLEELRLRTALTDKHLTRESSKMLRSLGVKVHYTRLRDFAATRVLTLTGRSLVSIDNHPQGAAS